MHDSSAVLCIFKNITSLKNQNTSYQCVISDKLVKQLFRNTKRTIRRDHCAILNCFYTEEIFFLFSSWQEKKKVEVGLEKEEFVHTTILACY